MTGIYKNQVRSAKTLIHKCKSCGKGYDREDRLKRHEKKNHFEPEQNDAVNEEYKNWLTNEL